MNSELNRIFIHGEDAFMYEYRVAVGHASDVIRHHSCPTNVFLCSISIGQKVLWRELIP